MIGEILDALGPAAARGADIIMLFDEASTSRAKPWTLPRAFATSFSRGVASAPMATCMSTLPAIYSAPVLLAS